MRNYVHISRKLRKDSTEAEKLIWKHLRARKIEGLKFRRQQQIGRYIVDFVCLKKKLVIEIDGGQHALQEREDKERDALLREHGYKILRFWNNEVLSNIQGVLEAISTACMNHPPLAPTLKGGESE